MIIKVYSAITIGIESKIIPIEIHAEPYTNFALSVLGLSEYYSSQLKKRIEIACKNNGIELPPLKITINMGLFHGDKGDIILLDLPIAIGVLKILNHIDPHFYPDAIIVGELGLDGVLRPIKGVLSIAIECAMKKNTALVIPLPNSKEVELIDGIDIYGAYSLRQILEKKELTKIIKKDLAISQKVYDIDYADVKGQALAKRALQISAAGRHNIIFMGPPGSGKTMLAQRLPTIMPTLSFDEILETSRIYSSLGNYHDLVLDRPFRSPHHTTSLVGLIGGGINPAPGEISLAHNGILFLDEFTEFKPPVIEALRQPLESHKVNIIRKSQTVTYPASFLLVAAFNPCPCGHAGNGDNICQCTAGMVHNYLSKISGPILDRIDLQVNLKAVKYDDITQTGFELDSKTMAIQVNKALVQQQRRYGNTLHNGMMTPADIEVHCVLNAESEALMKNAFDKLKLSMRGYHKVLRIARTIADLEGSDFILTNHLKEALTYRSLDQTINKLKS